jgi:phage regulator Rha-like protein
MNFYRALKKWFMSDDPEKLKLRVLDFVKTQQEYNEKLHEDLQVFCIQKAGCMIIYGKDERAGISGVGATPDLAFSDFIKRWKDLKGFEWIEKKR